MKRYKLAPIAEPSRPSLRQRLDATRASAAQTLRRTRSAEPLPQAAAACVAGPDAELLRLEAEWLRIRAAEDASYERQERIAETGEHLGMAPEGLEPWKAWYAESTRWRISSGIEAEEEGSRRLCCEAYDLTARVATISAVTLVGLHVKARLLLYYAGIQTDPPKGLLEGLADDLLAMGSTLTAAEAPATPRPELLDFSPLSILQLSNLYERFTRAADFWNDAVHLPWAMEDGQGSRFRDLNAAGEIMDEEGDRAALLRDAVANEIENRDLPISEAERDHQLEARIRHELACNGSLRHAPTLIMGITESWVASA